MSDSRTRIWFSLFVLAIFCLGLSAGFLAGRRMPPRPGRPPLFGEAPRGRGPGFGPGRGGPGPGMLLDRIDRELHLTSEQRNQVRSIFDERRGRLEAVQRDAIARADQERLELQAEIRKVLTPEQQQRFDRWLETEPRGRGRGF
jgi:Spy/CpxP family protein refolding chaperone